MDIIYLQNSPIYVDLVSKNCIDQSEQIAYNFEPESTSHLKPASIIFDNKQCSPSSVFYITYQQIIFILITTFVHLIWGCIYTAITAIVVYIIIHLCQFRDFKIINQRLQQTQLYYDVDNYHPIRKYVLHSQLIKILQYSKQYVKIDSNLAQLQRMKGHLNIMFTSFYVNALQAKLVWGLKSNTNWHDKLYILQKLLQISQLTQGQFIDFEFRKDTFIKYTMNDNKNHLYIKGLVLIQQSRNDLIRNAIRLQLQYHQIRQKPQTKEILTRSIQVDDVFCESQSSQSISVDETESNQSLPQGLYFQPNEVDSLCMNTLEQAVSRITTQFSPSVCKSANATIINSIDSQIPTKPSQFKLFDLLNQIPPNKIQQYTIYQD